MLRCFFEEGADPGLFSGLKIMEAGEKYTSEMCKYPVIFLTLKSAKTGDEKSAFKSLRDEIAGEFRRHDFVLESDALSEDEKEKFIAYTGWKPEPEEYKDSLIFLCSYKYGAVFERSLLRRFRKYRNNYFKWLEDFSLPPFNNLSERSLRCVKSHMKISGQFESVEAAENYAIIKSYIETCRRNKVNEMDALKRLCEGKPYTIQEILSNSLPR